MVTEDLVPFRFLLAKIPLVNSQSTRGLTNMRTQTGNVILRSKVWYVRFYNRDGKRVTQQLEHPDGGPLKKEGVYKSVARVQDIVNDVMRDVNSDNGVESATVDVTVGEFWEATYLPWAEANLRASTVAGYKKTWGLYLKDQLSRWKLREYKTPHGSQLLSGLTEKRKLGAATLSHTRSLASGIFSHALNLGRIEANPWHDVVNLARVKKSKPTKQYTLEEAENTITALVSRVDAQGVFALAYFLGLRPSEIAGLQWSDVDFDGGFIHIRRAAVKGVVGETKTPESVASLPLIAPVRIPLELWRAKCSPRSAASGWIFCNQRKGPLNVESFCRNIIIPLCKKANVEWKSLYSARRGCGQHLTALTGNLLAARAILRHKSMLTTAEHYDKANEVAGAAGLKLVEAKALRS
jgi:integrase